MMNEKVRELLNQQINKEFYSAYLYLDFSNYFQARGLDGFANWYMIQAQEERDHAMLFMEYLQQNGEAVVLEAIDKPDKEFNEFLRLIGVANLTEQKKERLITNEVVQTQGGTIASRFSRFEPRARAVQEINEKWGLNIEVNYYDGEPTTEKEIDEIMGTFYRQTLFAHYELEVSRLIEKNQPINHEVLSNIMIDLYQRYYGIDIKEEKTGE